MKHARHDYNRIQDPALEDPTLLGEGCSPVGKDEPVFLIRGNDENFVDILEAYRRAVVYNFFLRLYIVERNPLFLGYAADSYIERYDKGIIPYGTSIVDEKTELIVKQITDHMQLGRDWHGDVCIKVPDSVED